MARTNTTKITAKTDVWRCASWTEYVAKVNAPNPHPTGALATQNSSHSAGGSFRGAEDWDGACALAGTGWLEGTRKVQAMATKLAGHVAGRRPKQVPVLSATMPGALDIGRYAAGQPDCMVVLEDSEDETETAGRGVVKVRFNESVSGSVSGDAIFVRGAACVILVDWLEQAGYRVELELATANRAGIGQVELVGVTTVTLKRAEDALDMDRLSFALCHPATLRRFAFARFERMPEALQQQVQFGYGTPADMPAEDGTIDLPSHLGEAGPDAALRWVCEELVRQGITVEQD